MLFTLASVTRLHKNLLNLGSHCILLGLEFDSLLVSAPSVLSACQEE